MSSHWPDDFLPVSSCLKDVLISSGSLLPGACIQILGSTGRSCNQAFFTKAHLESELEHQGTGPRISRASVQFGRRCLYLWVRYNMGHALKTWVYSQHSQKGSEKGVCNQDLFWKQNTTIATCWPEDFLSVSLCQKDVLISSGSLLPGACIQILGSTGRSCNQAFFTKAHLESELEHQGTGPRISRASVQFGRRCLYLWVRYNMGHALKTWVYCQHSQKSREKGVCNQDLFWKRNTTISVDLMVQKMRGIFFFFCLLLCTVLFDLNLRFFTTQSETTG